MHCVLTSPPYWALRDYGTGTWVGGDPDCQHKGVSGGGGGPSRNGSLEGMGGQAHVAGAPNRGGDPRRCRCGASLDDDQIGLEANPDEYISNMVSVFREIRRVLRDDGTAWLNIGDSYATSPKGPGGDDRSTLSNAAIRRQRQVSRVAPRVPGLKPKDLVGIPWKLAFALQADGWYLRSDIVKNVRYLCPCGCGFELVREEYASDGEIIWAKSNPMPESVTDRPTKSHEFVFLLAKSGDPTYWTHLFGEHGRRTKPEPDYWLVPRSPGPAPRRWAGETFDPEVWRRVNAWRGQSYFFDEDAVREPAEWERWGDQTVPKYSGTKTATGWMEPASKETLQMRTTRNIRSVWEISTQPYADAHFATWPEEIAERIIKAGTSEHGCCPECGAPWERVVERSGSAPEPEHRHPAKRLEPGQAGNVGAGNMGFRSSRLSGQEMAKWKAENPDQLVGWVPTCGCVDRLIGTDVERPYRPVPCVIMDPFMGSGTTAVVGRRLGRHTIGIELNEDYCDLILERTKQLSLLT